MRRASGPLSKWPIWTKGGRNNIILIEYLTYDVDDVGPARARVSSRRSRLETPRAASSDFRHFRVILGTTS